MNASFLQDLMRAYSRDGSGLFVMLECYIDDSGTHDGSKVIVWGGVAGYQQDFEVFEKAWNDRLQHPCGNKPPLVRGFHSSHLSQGVGEFKGYNQAERDRTRFNFRQVIISAGLSFISCGISVTDWKKYAKGLLEQSVHSAERLVFGQVIMFVCESAHENGEHISFQFDKGRESHVLPIIQSAIDVANIDGELVSHGFSSVSKNVGLQAADLVAHETYQYCTKYIDDKSVRPDPHLIRLLEDAYDGKISWFGRDEILSLVNELKISIKTIGMLTSSFQKDDRQ